MKVTPIPINNSTTMKFLLNTDLEDLSNSLSVELGYYQVTCRLESYSCKMVGEDKRFFKSFKNGGDVKEPAMLSPPQTLQSGSPFATSYSSSTDDGESPITICDRKTIYYLISTLNVAFDPDYDFSDAKSEEFSLEPSPDFAKNYIDACLKSTIGKQYTGVSNKLWTAIDKEIQLDNCSVFSYKPDLESDPFGDSSSLYSFCFFFYNRHLRRILFFCFKRSQQTQDSQFFCESDGEEQTYDNCDSSFTGNVPLML